MKTNDKHKEKIIDETLRLLAERYPIGLYEFLFKYEPEMYKELRDLEDDINRVYDHKSIDDLKAVMRKYWILHMEAIKVNIDILNNHYKEFGDHFKSEFIKGT